MLLIDPRPGDDRTIGFWTMDAKPIGLEALATWSWSSVAVADQHGVRALVADSLRYHALSSSPLREHVLEHARARGWTIDRLTARVESIRSEPETAVLLTDDGASIRARWAFDSRLAVDQLRARILMWQSFDGASWSDLLTIIRASVGFGLGWFGLRRALDWRRARPLMLVEARQRDE